MKRDLKSSTFRAIAILLLLAALVLYCMSLADVAIITSEQSIKGFWILLTGWMGFIVFQFAWYANVLALMSVLLMRGRPFCSLIASGAALLLVTQAFLFDEIPAVGEGEPILVLARGTGFYLWIAGITCLFYACIFMLIYRRFSKASPRADGNELSAIEVDTTTPILPPEPVQVKRLSFPKGVISTPSNP